ncbi:MAG: hypothetical protein BI182_16895 [Acetobacterium sp. MES1]|uniref:hypothetical protein n=1 Tax=Acetobacterium sp. MES1 TaxID=1899015 RepID=UPI000B9D0CE4|nr:hypothetical protein [Acetobacterium sp. MES1]OXS24874.1 MAG: hypothetical protein BI182_16895 [Acetobacterium sp. MES1]
MKKSIRKLTIISLSLLLVIGLIPTSVMATSDPTVSYCTHVQNVGWQDYVGPGKMSGTEGKSYRLEGIKINLDAQGYDLGIEYQTHVQNIGWEANTEKGWSTSNGFSGTEGLGYRLEAIQIKLTGADADKFNIYYKVHAQNVGWMGWAKNGEPAGTAGYGYRLEGIKIVISPANEDPPELGSGTAFNDATIPQFKEAYKNVVYQLFVQNGKTYGYSQYACPYSLFDIDSNGIPELFVKKGISEANYEYVIYTFENDQAKFIGTTNGGHASLFGKTNGTSGELLLRMAHMGYQQISEIGYVNGEITTNMISNEELPAGVDYFKTSYPVPWAYARDTSLLN